MVVTLPTSIDACKKMGEAMLANVKATAAEAEDRRVQLSLQTTEDHAQSRELMSTEEAQKKVNAELKKVMTHARRSCIRLTDYLFESSEQNITFVSFSSLDVVGGVEGRGSPETQPGHGTLAHHIREHNEDDLQGGLGGVSQLPHGALSVWDGRPTPGHGSPGTVPEGATERLEAGPKAGRKATRIGNDSEHAEGAERIHERLHPRGGGCTGLGALSAQSERCARLEHELGGRRVPHFRSGSTRA